MPFPLMMRPINTEIIKMQAAQKSPKRNIAGHVFQNYHEKNEPERIPVSRTPTPSSLTLPKTYFMLWLLVSQDRVHLL